MIRSGLVWDCVWSGVGLLAVGGAVGGAVDYDTSSL